MFGVIKKVFVVAMTFFNFNPLNVKSLECVSVNNQKCKIRPEIIIVNNNESVFYPFSIKLNSSASNNKQRWNKDKCRCECKELVNKQECDK